MASVFKNIIVFFAALLAFTPSFARDLQSIKQSGEIYIGFDESEIGNINYKLAHQFADYLDLELKEVIVDWNSLFTKNGLKADNLESDSSLKYTPDAFKKIDLYAGSISPLEWRKRLFDFAPTLVSAEVFVVKKSLAKKPGSVNDIAGMKIALMDGTSFVFHMNEHIKKINGNVELIKTETGADSKKMLIEGKADAIILDASDALTFIMENNGQYEILFPISKISKLVWAVEHNNKLKNEVEHFISYIINNGSLDQLFEEEYGVRYSLFEEELKPRTTIQKYHRDLDEILNDRKIVISLRERDFVYHKKGAKQFMHILAEEFAAYLGVDFEYVVIPGFSKYWEDKNGIISQDSSYTPDIYNYFDLACDIFAPLDWRKKKVDLIPVYETDYAVLAKKNVNIQSVDDLKNYTAVVAKNTIYEQLVRNNGVKKIKYSSINDMVDEVIKGNGDFTIIYNAFLYPELEQKIKMGSTHVTWGLRYDQPLLREALLNFLAESERNGLLNALKKISEGTVLTNIEDFLLNYYQSSQIGTLPHILVGADQGLPQEDINSIFQDENGYLWFGTLSGAVKYNGKQMISYNVDNGLISNQINYITQDNYGRMFLATSKGFSIIENNKIENIEFDKNIIKIYFDNENRAWLLTESGVYKYFKNEISSFDKIEQNSIGLVNSICFDTLNAKYYLGAESGLYEFDLISEQLKNISNLEVYSAMIDVDYNLWFSNEDGVYLKCLRENCENQDLVFVNESVNIPNTKIIDISQSKSGSIWLINSRNVYEISSLKQNAILYKTGEDLINNVILSFAEDREGNIWIGYSGGLQKIINNKSLRNFHPEIINHSISSVSIDEYDNIWINTNKAIFKYNNESKSLENLNYLFKLNNELSISIKTPQENSIIIANENGLFEINAVENTIIRSNLFKLESANKIFISDNSEIIIASANSGDLVYLKAFDEKPIFINNENTQNISDIIFHRGMILISESNKILEFNRGELRLISEFPYPISTMASVENQLFIGTNKGVHTLNNPDAFSSFGDNVIIKDIIPSRSRNHLWIGTNNGIFYFNKHSKEFEINLTKKDGLNGNEIVEDGLLLDRKGLLWISTYHGLSNFDIRSNTRLKFSPNCFLDSLVINGKSGNFLENNKFKYNQNNIVFNLSALFFSDESSIEYEHYLRGVKLDYDFVRQDKSNKIYYNNLDPGKYTLVYRARGKDGIWSESASFSFEITKPIWEQWWFRILAIIAIGAILFSIYKIRVKQIVIQKQKLEDLVNIRTQELQKANSEINSKNKQITDSIQYAERIQQSVLPKYKVFDENFADYFILFKPRDIVSGDFYWTHKLGSKIIVCAADCTGHGVPGAFMSMLGMSFLKEIVSKSNISKPGLILDELRNEVIRALQQEGKINEAKDGMDLSLISFDTESKILEYAGANNAIYIFSANESPDFEKNKRVRKRENNFYEIQPDKMPIAIYEKMESFSTFEKKLKTGDRVYLYSDGYADQFGGPNNKKFKYPKFRKIITSTLNKDMTHQFAKLEVAFDEWKKNQSQVDDVTVIGFEVG